MLLHLSEMRKFFDQSAVFDRGGRDYFITNALSRREPNYTFRENAAITRGLALQREFRDLSHGEKQNIKGDTSIVTVEVTLKLSWKNRVFGRTTTIVKAPLLQVSAYECVEGGSSRPVTYFICFGVFSLSPLL